MNKEIQILDWGTIAYPEALNQQYKLLNQIVNQKLKNRTRPTAERRPTPNFLIFCEHPHVFTMGSQTKKEHLLASSEELSKNQIACVQTRRGGDITYHGTGQLVIYPILDLDNFLPDVHNYIRTLEEVIILALKKLGIQSQRIKSLTGVWIKAQDGGVDKKICAIGVKITRWVTMHGLALNVSTDLSYFNFIVPCGIADKSVTSIEKELVQKVQLEEIKQLIIPVFLSLFSNVKAK